MKMHTIKTRKKHDCSYCENPIMKGEECYFFTHRGPEYERVNDEDLGWFTTERQIGVHYIRGHRHLHCITAPDNDKSE